MTVTTAESTTTLTAAEIAKAFLEAGGTPRNVATTDLEAGDVISFVGRYQTVVDTEDEDGWTYVRFAGMNLRGDFSSYDYHEVMN